MNAYYDDGFATIYHGDCRDVLPELRGDLVLTDFPYAVGIGYDGYDDTLDGLDRLIADTLPLLRDTAPIVAMTCGIANIWRYPPASWVLCWYQTNAPTASGRWGFNQWQPILVYGGDPYLKRGLGRRPDTIAVGASGKDLCASRDVRHPCVKPLGPWTAILRRLSPAESNVIVDPFAGSGTTLIAAKYSGRRAIGVEQSEAYCELAASRLAQGVLDLEGAS